MEYSWDFDEGEGLNSSFSPSNLYESAGIYNVSLTIIEMMHLGINLMMDKDIGIIIIGTMNTSPIGTIPINITDQLRHPGYNIKVII